MTGTVKSGKRDQSGLGRMGFAHYSRGSLSQSSGLVRPPLPDVPGQENCGGGVGQASESAGTEAHNPGGKLRCPPELVERDAEQEGPEEPSRKADAGIEPDRCPSVPRSGNGEHARGEIRKITLHDEAGSHRKT